MPVKIQILRFLPIFTKLNLRRLPGARRMHTEYAKYSYSISNKRISIIQIWIDSLDSYEITSYQIILLPIVVVVQSR